MIGVKGVVKQFAIFHPEINVIEISRHQSAAQGLLQRLYRNLENRLLSVRISTDIF
jgi:hypothetical protein